MVLAQIYLLTHVIDCLNACLVDCEGVCGNEAESHDEDAAHECEDGFPKGNESVQVQVLPEYVSGLCCSFY
jgi:hypothetical protein